MRSNLKTIIGKKLKDKRMKFFRNNTIKWRTSIDRRVCFSKDKINFLEWEINSKILKIPGDIWIDIDSSKTMKEKSIVKDCKLSFKDNSIKKIKDEEQSHKAKKKLILVIIPSLIPSPLFIKIQMF